MSESFEIIGRAFETIRQATGIATIVAVEKVTRYGARKKVGRLLPRVEPDLIGISVNAMIVADRAALGAKYVVLMLCLVTLVGCCPPSVSQPSDNLRDEIRQIEDKAEQRRREQWRDSH